MRGRLRRGASAPARQARRRAAEQTAAGPNADTNECPDMGETVDVLNASLHLWGDVDCGGDVNPVNSLKLLRFDAGLGVSQEAGCPPIGSEVQIIE